MFASELQRVRQARHSFVHACGSVAGMEGAARAVHRPRTSEQIPGRRNTNTWYKRKWHAPTAFMTLRVKKRKNDTLQPLHWRYGKVRYCKNQPIYPALLDEAGGAKTDMVHTETVQYHAWLRRDRGYKVREKGCAVFLLTNSCYPWHASW